MSTHYEHKWILISCLQKAIRKGLVSEAVSYGEELWDIDRNYLIYRLSIIAIEDIGIANIDLVHEFIKTEIKKKNIEELGGKDYILGLIKKFSLSIKDRSACDLINICSFCDEKYKIEAKEKEDIFLDKEEVLIKRMMAGWECLGSKKIKNDYVYNKEDNLEKFLELNQKLTKNQKILDLISICYKIHREPHFIALGLLESSFEEEKNNQIGKYKVGDFVYKKYQPKYVQNKNWIIDGVDWHTKEGKYAIYELLKTKAEVSEYCKQYLLDKDSLASAIGMILFRTIGQEVDKRLVYNTAISIYKITDEINLRSSLLNEQVKFSEAKNAMLNSLDILHKKINEQFYRANPNYFPF